MFPLMNGGVTLTRQQRAWSKVLNALGTDLTADISEPIPASSFQEFAQTEARLAAKMDSSKDVPPVLRDRGLFPLPVTNGTYRLVRGKGFHELENIDGPIQSFQSQLDFKTCTTTGQSESMLLNYAYNAGLISHFIGKDEIIKGHEGRQYAKKFSFNVGSVGPIEQQGSQIQVDGLFEGPNSVIIIEAKTRPIDDFIIRQLYYPLRHWAIETDREISTIFLHIDPGTKVYTFWQYKFNDLSDYASIELVSGAKFRIHANPRLSSDLQNVSSGDNFSFVPQADSVDKILRIPFLVSQGYNTADVIAKKMQFQERQGNYYSEAAEGLELINRQQEERPYRFTLTDVGKEILMARPDRRAEILARQMMKIPLMKSILNELIDRAERSPEGARGLSREDIAQLIKENSRFSGTTPYRRAGSIMSWFTWLSETYGQFQVVNNNLYIEYII